LIARNYYYLVASLPYINYGDKPPFSSTEFLENCNAMLSPADASLLQYCCYDPKIAIETTASTGSAFIDFHMLRERVAALNLAYLRAAKLNRPSPGEPPHDVPRSEAVAKAAFEMEDPMEAMIYIDRARWGVLDEMVGINYFGVNNIYAYLLKLRLLERKLHYEVEKGFAVYREVYDTIINSIPRYKEDR